MEKRLGYGEYERTDIETRISTQYMRGKFLQVLVDRKEHWAKSLLSVVNYALLPEKLRKDFKEEQIFAFYLSHLYGDNPIKVEVPRNYIDTPIHHFFGYIDEKRPILESYEKEAEEIHTRPQSTREIQKKALRMLIPDWKTLIADPSTNDLCGSIRSWARNHNLEDDWCLDFALMILINFKTLFRFQNDDFQDVDRTMEKANTYALWFDQGIREALRKSLSDFYFEKVMSIRWHTAASDLEVPEFHFKHEELEYNSVTWYPSSKNRSDFIKETTRSFNRWCEAIKNFAKFENLNETAYREHLRTYCDDVEEQLLNNEQDVPLIPYSVNYLFSACWIPSETSRSDFIEVFIDNLKQGFAKGKKMAESLKTLDKDRFELELYSYCNRVKRNLPTHYERTPKKYNDTDRDFIWVVDNQIMPARTYSEIAEDERVRDETTPQAVKKAVERLCLKIGKLRRIIPRTGRPSGIKETQARHRAEK